MGEAIADQPKGENIFKSYLSVLKVKPFLGIAIWSLLYFIGNTILAGALVYFGVYVLGLSEATASTYFTISMIVTIVMAVPANWLAGKFGKKTALLLAMCVYLVCGLFVAIKGPAGLCRRSDPLHRIWNHKFHRAYRKLLHGIRYR